MVSFFFIFFFLFSLWTHVSFAADRISSNFTLSGDNTIVSSGGVFELGFYSFGTSSSNFYIGMWYKQLSEQTIVWIANRDKPVSDKNSSVLKISNGNLVLLDGRNQTPVWSTGLTSSAPSSLEAVLLDDGNLVLRDGGSVLWQSFDHPDRTWLPGGKIRFDKRTNKSQQLTAWKNDEDPSPAELPYFESATYVAYNNEDGGVIEKLKKEGIVNLDSDLQRLPDYISLKALIVSWLEQALTYELWVGTEGISTWKIYYSDLPWVIRKVLFYKQTYLAKTRLGINKENAEQREIQIYKRASEAYDALSTRLGEQKFLFEDRPSSLDAIFLSHILFTIQALPETSVLRSKLLEHSNLVRYAEKLKSEFLEASSSSPSPPFPSFPSSFSRKDSKPKRKPKIEKTEEQKKFKKRAKFFLAAQFLAVVIYLSVMGGSSSDELEFED